MQFDALVFDLDGTLWNTLAGCTKAWQQAVTEFGGEGSSITLELVKSAMGLTPHDFFAKVLPHFSDRERMQMGQRAVDLESFWIRKGLFEFYASLPSFFKELSRERSLFILSNCEKPYLDLFLELSETQVFIKAAACYRNPLENKTANLIYLKDKYHLFNPLYIGDTETDRVSCEKVKVDFCYASYGFGVITQPVDRSISNLLDLNSMTQIRG